jgi:hypothetical protein
MKNLHLQIEAEFVRRDEGRFRRTPRVEAEMIQAVRLRHADDAFPFRHIRGRMTGLGKDGAFQRAAKKRLAPVDG